MASTTFNVRCTCGCRRIVEARCEGFEATTVELAACPRLAATGVASQTVRKSVAYDRAVAPATVRYEGGLVTFDAPPAFEVVGLVVEDGLAMLIDEAGTVLDSAVTS